MLNVMLDLETMGKGPNAAIVSIGAVVFDPQAGTVQDRSLAFYCNVDLESAVTAGGVMDASTVMWWMDQDSQARVALLHKSPPTDIKLALLEFQNWVEASNDGPPSDVAIWGNGAAFDNVILRRAYERLGMEPPWKFWGDRCYRTLKALHPEVPLPPDEGVHHNALDDAIFQARHALEILKPRT